MSVAEAGASEANTGLFGDPALRAALQAGLERLGYDAFRPGQEQAVTTLLEVGRLLLVAPTGGGKSLTYQLPAMLLPGITLVISPLIALMHDQVAALERRGVPATYLASTLSPREARSRLEAVREGRCKLIYVSPERLAMSGTASLLAGLPCSLVAVDEAHCISEWGHDFRPEYLLLGDILASLPSSRVLACTATATPVVRDEIIARLRLPPDTPQHVQGFARPNLVLRAREVNDKKERDRSVDALLEEALGGPRRGKGGAIIYAPTRREVETETARLAAQGWSVAGYHAGIDASLRTRVQNAYVAGHLEIVVATNAFGMGVDRSDVRAVVHLAPPGSIEAYYQEVGRGGRDGAIAYGLLLLGPTDMALRRRLIEGDPNEGPTPPRIVEHKWNLFLELVRWIEGGSCRHDAILRYFGARRPDEASPPTDDDVVLGAEDCGRCDVCASIDSRGEVDAEAAAMLVRKGLSGIARVSGRYGMTAAVNLLRGQNDPRLERAGLAEVKTFGALSGYSEPFVSRLLTRCVTAGYATFTGDERPRVLLTRRGGEVMKGLVPARVLPPAVDRPQVARTDGGERGGAKPDSGRGRTRSVDPEALDARALALFESLRLHRLAVARDEGVPPYVVASDRTLRELAMLRPRTREDLSLAYGIGPTKVERYGEGFLRVIRAEGSRSRPDRASPEAAQ